MTALSYGIGSNALLDAAYGYIESSPQWPIIPIAPSKKRPYISTGTDHAEGCSTDPDVIREWFRRWPDMEIGTPTGRPSGTVVIDVDPPDGERLLAVLERVDVLGPLPRERVMRSPRGGLQIFCARPDTEVRIALGAGGRSKLGKLLGGRDGIDVRADGGLTVLPPCRGRRWIADTDGPLPELPKLWLAALTYEKPIAPRPIQPTTNSGSVTRARAYLATIPPTVQRDKGGDGGGQGAIWTVACRALHGFGISESDARSLIEEWCARCTPPWSEKEIEHTVSQAGKADPRRWIVEGKP